MENEDICPINNDRHRYFIFKTYDVFEPVNLGTGHDNIYEKVEYAVLGCNCSSVIRKRVKELWSTSPAF